MGERFVRKYATWADMYEDHGLQRGLLQGRQEGRQEGREEGELLATRATLKRLLTKRFGELPAATAARIDAASRTDLTAWTDRLLDCDNMAALFG